MKAISRTISLRISMGIFVTALASKAFAGCGDLSNLQGPFTLAQPSVLARLATPTAQALSAKARGTPGTDPSVVGFWKVQFISQGNTGHNPSIPDGALIDFGYTQWHTDGTEIQNSAGVPGGGFCLGIWGQTGYLTFEINHFPIAFNPTTGDVANYINIREQVTLSPSGDSFTGTFTEDVYDPTGKQVDQVGGNIVATRLTVDTTMMEAIPNQ